MAIIKVMDEILANKIAAGEVVERCASVVKELVENSIDAGADEIKVELTDAGTKEIKVIDNGKGMDESDAVLAFSRHATSKISDEDDLYRLNTLGFRGEALASIAAVSKVDLKTSQGDVGTHVLINGGRVELKEKSDARKGTIISVKELFYNTPARLKHMKSLYSELANVTDYMNKLSLSRPDIRFTLTNNGSVILRTDGSFNTLKTIQSIYGTDVARKMLKIKAENADYEIEGYISSPEVHRSTRNNMITLVNGRVVKNTDINRVINDSYHSYKPDNRYPITVIHITVDPSVIDVNIHPTKMDIKFSKMDTLLELIEMTIKKTISNINFIPEVQIKKPKEKYEEMTLDLEREKSDISFKEPEIVVNDFKETIVYEEDTTGDVVQEASESYEDVITHYEKYDEKSMPEMYPVGLVHGTYIICQNEKGMYIIDQHAAKERCNYEKFKEEMGKPNIASTPLLFPITMELSNTEFMILKENMNILRNLKFDIEEFGVNSVIIKAHPTWIMEGYEEEAIKKIIEIVISTQKDFDIEKFNEKVATMMSCKKAIKANTNITMEEMEVLVSDLRKCKNPYNCPHGRPTTIFYSNYDLEKLFKRSGFDTIK
ncbi:MAG: DNA mismatch repair endonuclease MutL [Bacilli bacterium]|nr:DNA mismatch repair endonuclease MutL [Bacilli bacterium]